MPAHPHRPFVLLYWHDCRRCGHHWLPRIADVRICPACKSARWDQLKGAEPAAAGVADNPEAKLAATVDPVRSVPRRRKT
jgi:hypothetical protein